MTTQSKVIATSSFVGFDATFCLLFCLVVVISSSFTSVGVHAQTNTTTTVASSSTTAAAAATTTTITTNSTTTTTSNSNTTAAPADAGSANVVIDTLILAAREAVSVTSGVVTGVTAFGTAIIGTVSPALATLAARVGLIQRLSACRPDLHTPLEFHRSPTGVAIDLGEPAVRYHVGACVMNVVVALAFGACSLVYAQIHSIIGCECCFLEDDVDPNTVLEEPESSGGDAPLEAVVAGGDNSTTTSDKKNDTEMTKPLLSPTSSSASLSSPSTTTTTTTTKLVKVSQGGKRVFCGFFKLRSLGAARFPGCIVFPILFLLQSTIGSVLVCLIHGNTGSALMALAVLFVILFVMGIFALRLTNRDAFLATYRTREQLEAAGYLRNQTKFKKDEEKRRQRHRDRAKAKLERLKKEQQQQNNNSTNKTGDEQDNKNNNHDEDNDTDEEHEQARRECRSCNRWYEDEVEGVQGWYFDVPREDESLSYEDREKIAIDRLKKYQHHDDTSHFFHRYGAAFDYYRGEYRMFVLWEFVVCAVLGLLDGLVEAVDCHSIAIALVVIFAIYVALVAFIQPYSTKKDMRFYGAIALVQFVGCLLTVIPGAGEPSVGIMMTIALCIGIVQAIEDVLADGSRLIIDKLVCGFVFAFRCCGCFTNSADSSNSYSGDTKIAMSEEERKKKAAQEKEKEQAAAAKKDNARNNDDEQPKQEQQKENQKQRESDLMMKEVDFPMVGVSSSSPSCGGNGGASPSTTAASSMNNPNHNVNDPLFSSASTCADLINKALTSSSSSPAETNINHTTKKNNDDDREKQDSASTSSNKNQQPFSFPPKMNADDILLGVAAPMTSTISDQTQKQQLAPPPKAENPDFPDEGEDLSSPAPAPALSGFAPPLAPLTPLPTTPSVGDAARNISHLRRASVQPVAKLESSFIIDDDL